MCNVSQYSQKGNKSFGTATEICEEQMTEIPHENDQAGNNPTWHGADTL